MCGVHVVGIDMIKEGILAQVLEVYSPTIWTRNGL